MVFLLYIFLFVYLSIKQHSPAKKSSAKFPRKSLEFSNCRNLFAHYLRPLIGFHILYTLIYVPMDLKCFMLGHFALTCFTLVCFLFEYIYFFCPVTYAKLLLLDIFISELLRAYYAFSTHTP